MAELELTEPWIEMSRLLEAGRSEELQKFISELSSGDLALAVSRLAPDLQSDLLAMVPPKAAADIVEQLPEVQAVELLTHLPPTGAAAILDLLPSDEQADLISELDESDADAILQQMDPAEAEDARRLSEYPSDVAGGLMVTEFLDYPDNSTCSHVIRDLRQRADEYRDYDIQYAYVVDRHRRLVGVLRLRDLLLAPEDARVRDSMIGEPLAVSDTMPLEELVDFFDRHHFLGVPVIDPGGQILGVVQKRAVDEAYAEQHDSDYLKIQGIVGGEELRSLPTWLRARRRLSWLSVNILLNIVAASVIALFQDTLSAVIALAVFLPIISDMSGCSGSQAAAVSLRELSLGLLRPNELLRVWLKEMSIGLISGVVLGLIIALVAWLWQGDIYLGVVAGLALAINTLIAVSVGGLIPLVLKRLHVDPAIAAVPLLTTITDMCGFFLVLGIASQMLEYLVR